MQLGAKLPLVSQNQPDEHSQRDGCTEREARSATHKEGERFYPSSPQWNMLKSYLLGVECVRERGGSPALELN